MFMNSLATRKYNDKSTQSFVHDLFTTISSAEITNQDIVEIMKRSKRFFDTTCLNLQSHIFVLAVYKGLRDH